MGRGTGDTEEIIGPLTERKRGRDLGSRRGDRQPLTARKRGRAEGPESFPKSPFPSSPSEFVPLSVYVSYRRIMTR